jgi:acyl-CoA dehydrogenase
MQFQSKLDWMARIVQGDIRALETLNLNETALSTAIDRLQLQVQSQGLWAAHLHPSLGGRGFGQVKLALMHEVLGGCALGVPVFGAGVDADATEVVSAAGTAQQRRRWVAPLVAGEISAAFAFSEVDDSITDATSTVTTAANRDGRWVLNGRNWLISDTANADFMVVVAVTDSGADRHHRTSAFIVPLDTPGVHVVRTSLPGDLGDQATADSWPSRTVVILEEVGVPGDAMLGAPGDGSAIARNPFWSRRVHHCMRWIGQARRVLALIREQSSQDRNGRPDERDTVTARDWMAVADAQIEAARLMTLRAAWIIDNYRFGAARKDAARIKLFSINLLRDVIEQALHTDRACAPRASRPLQSIWRAAQTELIYRGHCEPSRDSATRLMPRDTPQARLSVLDDHPQSAAAANRWDDMTDPDPALLGR